MFKAGPAPASIAPVTLEGGKYKFKITRAQQGEGWFSFMMSVVDVIEGQQSEVGLQSLMFRTDPGAKLEDLSKRDKAIEEMKHLVWACGKEGFNDVGDLVGIVFNSKVTKYSYTDDVGEVIEKNGFYPQLPEKAPLAVAANW